MEGNGSAALANELITARFALNSEFPGKLAVLAIGSIVNSDG
jgi:hypothetical protein